jgi:hypothetical protein
MNTGQILLTVGSGSVLTLAKPRKEGGNDEYREKKYENKNSFDTRTQRETAQYR